MPTCIRPAQPLGWVAQHTPDQSGTRVTVTPVRPAYVHTEAQLETLFRLRVRGLGGIIEKLAPTRKGIPDRLVLLPCNRIWLVELKKTPSHDLSPIQRVWHDRARPLVGRNLCVLHGLAEIDAWTRDRAREYDHLMELL